MAISTEIRERIYTTADKLLAANEKGEWPTVEEVRQASRAGMAAVVECMRDWRAKQRRPAVILPALPAELATIVQDAAAQLWLAAQKHAADNVAAQQAALEAERTEMLELSAQQAAAFEAQTAELERLQEEVITLKTNLLTAKQDLETEREIARRAADEAATQYNKQLTKLNELSIHAREEAAQLRGELMGIRDAYIQLLENISTKKAEITKFKPIKSSKPKATTIEKAKKPKSQKLL